MEDLDFVLNFKPIIDPSDNDRQRIFRTVSVCSSNESKECSICQEELVFRSPDSSEEEEDSTVVMSNYGTCHHMFHLGCIDRYVRSNKDMFWYGNYRCPNCRVPFVQIKGNQPACQKEVVTIVPDESSPELYYVVMLFKFSHESNVSPKTVIVPYPLMKVFDEIYKRGLLFRKIAHDVMMPDGTYRDLIVSNGFPVKKILKGYNDDDSSNDSPDILSVYSLPDPTYEVRIKELCTAFLIDI